MAPTCQSQVLDHLGLVAAMYEELGIGTVIDHAIPQDATKRTISLGQVFKRTFRIPFGDFTNTALHRGDRAAEVTVGAAY
jgi:hypothetical protein